MQKKCDDIFFTPIGGANEIGRNCYLYGKKIGNKTNWLMVDLGMDFPDEFMPGIDKVLPDISFISKQRDNLSGIVITHAHEDHSGALVAHWNSLKVPVYMTQFAWELVSRRLDAVPSGLESKVNIIPTGQNFQVGEFDLTFINAPHSIPESQSLAIHFEQGTVIHSGDWKSGFSSITDQPFKFSHIADACRGDCLALISDSTNATNDNVTASEDSIAGSLAELFNNAEKRVIITTFSSNFSRLVSVFRAAQKSGRKVVVAGRAIQRTLDAANACGLINEDLPVVDINTAAKMSRKKLVILATGSQGELRSALTTIAGGTHRYLSVDEGDTVIYSARSIPGNESGILRVQNQLIKRGALIITPEDANVHVSGHPGGKELKQLYDALRPKLLIPVHGEEKHIASHIKIGESAAVDKVVRVSNGSIASLLAKPGEIIKEYEDGAICLDGKVQISARDKVLKQRNRLKENGFIAASVVIDRKGRILAPISVISIGIPNGEKIELEAEKCLIRCIEKNIAQLRSQDDNKLDMVEQILKREVRKKISSIWGKKPEVIARIEVA